MGFGGWGLGFRVYWVPRATSRQMDLCALDVVHAVRCTYQGEGGEGGKGGRKEGKGKGGERRKEGKRGGKEERRGLG